MKRFLVFLIAALTVIGLSTVLSLKFQNQNVPLVKESENIESEKLVLYYQNKLRILQQMEVFFTDWSLDDPEKWARSAELAKESREEMELAIKLAQENKLLDAQSHCEIADNCVEKMKEIANHQRNKQQKSKVDEKL